MKWPEPIYSRERVNAAGKALVATLYDDGTGWTDEQLEDYWSQVEVINNWRSSHGYPLHTFRVNLHDVASRFDSSPIIAQRIKRLTSIGTKLERFPNMRLSQMQDLGGCRAIVHNSAAVRLICEYYEKSSGIKHERLEPDDYISYPKASGYRGVHLIYRYFSDKKKNIYNGLKIEMQLRSRFQHAWATAVETVGTFSGEALKSSIGSAKWRRFFSLMGSVIAMRERAPLVPGTPKGRGELIGELRKYATELKVAQRLREYGRALRGMTTHAAEVGDAEYYLMELDPSAGTLMITGFGANENEIATQRYAEVEKSQKQTAGADAVLVSVESINALQRAYPNYFADTGVFVQLMTQALEGRSKVVSLAQRQLEFS